MTGAASLHGNPGYRPIDKLHLVGRQGSVTDTFTDQVTAATVSSLGTTELPALD